MGDILGGVFGGGEQKNQLTKPTAQAKAANKIKVEELKKLFKDYSLTDFAGKNAKDYNLSPETRGIIKDATSSDNVMSLEEYMASGLNEGKGYINQVATPEIMSQLSLQGMERSGAAPEAIAKATAGIAMPFLSSIPGFMAARTQQAQGMASLSDMPRQLRVEDLMRRQGFMQTAFTGIPFSPSSKTEGGTSSLPLFNMFGMGGSM